jgi:thermostable 8-oxoguanine DNA glycosylase
MIDPVNITNYNQTKEQLEESILFWVCAAGKKATTAAKSLSNLLNKWSNGSSPFETIRKIIKKTNLSDEMRKHGIGCYSAKAKTFVYIVNSKIDLAKCTLEELESIPGIGPKTARCFLIHSRKNQSYAGLDTHVLKFLNDLGYQVPKSTPTKKKYLQLENEFIKICKRSGLSIAELDLKIWNAYSKNKGDKKDIFSLLNYNLCQV